MISDITIILGFFCGILLGAVVMLAGVGMLGYWAIRKWGGRWVE
jgi:hypothetical protein